MARYVPKTYNNRRILRIVIGAVITIALSVVILFLILFFIFRSYVVEGGRVVIPGIYGDEDAAPLQTTEEPNSAGNEDDYDTEDLEMYHDTSENE